MGKNSALDEIKAVKPEAAEDPEIQALSESLDIADQLAGFVNTTSGKETIKRLGAVVMGTLNELFDISRKGELGPLLGCIARIESNLTMLRRFTGAKADAQTLLDLLIERGKQK
jgi:hypothetical protein